MRRARCSGVSSASRHREPGNAQLVFRSSSVRTARNGGGREAGRTGARCPRACADAIIFTTSVPRTTPRRPQPLLFSNCFTISGAPPRCEAVIGWRPRGWRHRPPRRRAACDSRPRRRVPDDELGRFVLVSLHMVPFEAAWNARLRCRWRARACEAPARSRAAGCRPRRPREAEGEKQLSCARALVSTHASCRAREWTTAACSPPRHSSRPGGRPRTASADPNGAERAPRPPRRPRRSIQNADGCQHHR